MTKEDKQDVVIPCFGDARWCKVYHCNIAAACYHRTLEIEQERGSK